jgi:hypothetical protein
MILVSKRETEMKNWTGMALFLCLLLSSFQPVKASKHQVEKTKKTVQNRLVVFEGIMQPT